LCDLDLKSNDPADTGRQEAKISAEHGLELPKPPEIDKADIELVRNFFPGKLLGRTAALLSSVFGALALVYGVVGSLCKFVPITADQNALFCLATDYQ
jgi:hypothetical protein